MTLPNRRWLHALAKSLSGTSDAHETSVNIEGPETGTYTSYRVTEAGKQTVLQAAKTQKTLLDLAESA